MATMMTRTTRQARTKPAIIDCDIHNELDSERDLHPFLSTRWREHLAGQPSPSSEKEVSRSGRTIRESSWWTSIASMGPSRAN